MQHHQALGRAGGWHPREPQEAAGLQASEGQSVKSTLTLSVLDGGLVAQVPVCGRPAVTFTLPQQHHATNTITQVVHKHCLLSNSTALKLQLRAALQHRAEGFIIIMSPAQCHFAAGNY